MGLAPLLIAMNLRFTLLPLILGALVAVLPANAQKKEYLFELRSAIVEYQTTTTGNGMNSAGTETFWIDGSGRKTARLHKTTNTTKVFGRAKTEETENMSWLLDGWIYNADLKKKTGMKMSLEQAEKMAKQFGKGAQGDSSRAYAKDFIEKNGGRMLPPEEFLGRTCMVFELWGFKTWTYKGVMLKTEGTMAGMTVKTVATKFEENASIPSSVFALPKDIKFEDMPDLSGMLGGIMGGRPPGAEEEEETPKRQPKPAPRKPVVEEAGEPAPAPAPTPAPKPVVAKKPAPKPAPKAEPTGVKLSSEQFEAIVVKLHLPGYTTMAPESVGGGHTVNLIDTRGGAMGVTILPLAIADGLEKNEALKIESKFEHKKHAAFAGVLADATDGDSAIVLVRYPEKKLALLVSCNPVQPKEELLKLLEQIEL